MKKIIISIAVVASLVSCNKKKEVIEPNQRIAYSNETTTVEFTSVVTSDKDVRVVRINETIYEFRKVNNKYIELDNKFTLEDKNECMLLSSSVKCELVCKKQY